MNKLLVHGARQIVQVVSKGELVVAGDAMKNLAILNAEEGQGLSLAVDQNGKISAIGPDDKIKSQFIDAQFENVIDASGKCIVPGLIDGHTHAVWAGDRVHEFSMKLAGATYMDVHKAGGGIMFTVEHVHRASEFDLYQDLKQYLFRMLQAGTTMVEVKTGYGLDLDTEVKMLRVIERVRRDPHVCIDISTTYCGAHAVPKGKTAEEATTDIVNVQLPHIRLLMERGEVTVDNIDVFCETGVFDVGQSRRILVAGRNAGLALNFHAEELSCLYSAEMGAELGARAISHLEEISEDGMKAMANAQSVAVLLPTTAYILRLQAPPARRMIELGVPVALGSDFNPNAHCLAMPVVMHLACVLFRMSMHEVLMATTINAAASLGRSSTHGSLEVGKHADLLILDASRLLIAVVDPKGVKVLSSERFKRGLKEAPLWICL